MRDIRRATNAPIEIKGHPPEGTGTMEMTQPHKQVEGKAARSTNTNKKKEEWPPGWKTRGNATSYVKRDGERCCIPKHNRAT